MKKVSVYIFTALVLQFVLLTSCKEKENVVPTIQITSPEEGLFVMGGDMLTVSATAEDEDGYIQQVQFYVEYINVETVEDAPYTFSFEVSDTTIGVVDIRAVAIDNAGGVGTHSVDIIVDAPGGFNPDLSYGTLTDQDGNNYKTILIGDQNWMAENLKVSKYADGTPIDFIDDDAQWALLEDDGKAYCWYDNMNEYGDTTGALYSWPAAMNGAATALDTMTLIQGVCPQGWHLPSDEEWKVLEKELGMSLEFADKYEWRGTYEGGKLKERGFSHWDVPNSSGDNMSGFTALPGGYRTNSGTFYGMNEFAAFWTATKKAESTQIWFRALSFEKTNVYRYWVPGNRGASVRCLEN